MKQENTETKIIRCAMPLLVYILINIVVQTVYSFVVLGKKLVEYGDEDAFDYMFAYNFSSHMQDVVAENSLSIVLISGIIMIPAGVFMMYKDSIRAGTYKVWKKFPDIKAMVYVFLIGIFASMGISKLCTILPLDGIWGSYEQVNNEFAANSLAMQIIALVIFGPVTEEIIFRGLIYNRLKGYMGDTMAPVYISAAVFGIYHFNLVQGIYGFLLGILLCAVMEKYGTVLASMLLHMSANLMALIMMYLPFSRSIEGNIYLKILCMILELMALAGVLWKVNSRKEA